MNHFQIKGECSCCPILLLLNCYIFQLHLQISWSKLSVAEVQGTFLVRCPFELCCLIKGKSAEIVACDDHLLRSVFHRQLMPLRRR